MNFENYSNQWFKVDFDYYKRVFQVHTMSNGNLRFVNVLTGKTLFENIEFSQITINGNALENLNDLQEIIFNAHCECFLENKIPEPFKYFDLSFDESFE